jgi:hypothetical protein
MASIPNNRNDNEKYLGIAILLGPWDASGRRNVTGVLEYPASNVPRQQGGSLRSVKDAVGAM